MVKDAGITSKSPIPLLEAAWRRCSSPEMEGIIRAVEHNIGSKNTDNADSVIRELDEMKDRASGLTTVELAGIKINAVDISSTTPQTAAHVANIEAVTNLVESIMHERRPIPPGFIK